MATGISSPLALGGMYPSVDGRYVAANGKPFTSVSNAESALNGFPSKLSESCVGLTVLVKESGWTEAKEYWVQPKGTTPETYGLVVKGAGTTDYNDLENKPTIGDGTNTALPIVGKVKVSASTASGSTAGVTVTPGQNTGEIEMQFTLPKGDKGKDGANGATPTINQTTKHWEIGGSDTGVLAEGHNPNRGTYLDTDTKPTTGKAGDYIYVVNTSVTPRTANVWSWNGTDFANTGKSVENFGLTFASGQAVNGVHIKDENGEEAQGNADVLSAEAGQELNEQINGSVVYEDVEITDLRSDCYFNITSVTAIGDSYTNRTPNTLSGSYCYTKNVNAGETYKIWGKGYNAIGQYCLIDSDSKVVAFLKTTNSRTEPTVVVVEQDGILFVNFYEYDSMTDKLARVESHLEGGYKEYVDAKIADVEGVEGTVETVITDMYADKTFNMTAAVVGGSYTNRTPNANSGSNCQMIAVSAGETYKIWGKGYNAVGQYCLIDSESVVVSLLKTVDSRTDPTIVEVEEDGILFVNFYQYNASTDKTAEVEKVNVGGYKGYTDEKVKKLMPLNDRTIVCFGDSITELTNSVRKSWTDYLAALYGANVINVGVGGTQLRQRATPTSTPTTSDEAWAGVDIISMVKAACGVSGYDDIVTNSAQWLDTNEGENNGKVVERLLSIDWSKVDGVTVFAGTNDWNNGAGHLGVSGSSDIDTTLGAINEIIRLICTTYPHIKVYWYTPIIRCLDWNNGSGTQWSDIVTKSIGGGQSATLKEFSTYIENEVKLQHIPCCDLYNALGINQYNFGEYFNSNDGTHPYKAFDVIGNKIGAFIVANRTI